MENQQESEKLKLELLTFEFTKMRIELYERLLSEGNFDKDWLKDTIFGKNGEKTFDI